MSESKHTPGPWTEEAGEIRSGDIAIANVYDAEAYRSEFYEECRANAHLIAAAPDLQAACLLALQTINLYTTEPIPVGVYNRLNVALSDAIAKAKGGTS